MDVFSNKAHSWNTSCPCQCWCTCKSENNVVSTTTVLQPYFNLPRKSEAHCYTKKHVKMMLKIQCADNRCNSKDADQPARPLSRITSFFPILCTGGCRHNAPLSSVQIKNLWICGQSHRQFLDHEESTK